MALLPSDVDDKMLPLAPSSTTDVPPHTPVTTSLLTKATVNTHPLSPQATLDASAFPHIIRTIMKHADPATRLVLRQLNRKCRTDMDRISFEHAVVIVWWDGTVAVRAYRGFGLLYDFRYVEATEHDQGRQGQRPVPGVIQTLELPRKEVRRLRRIISTRDESGVYEVSPEFFASVKETKAIAWDNVSKEQMSFIVRSGHTPELHPVADLPSRVVDLLNHVITLDVVGHFDLLPPFPSWEPLLAFLDVVKAPRPSHRSPIYKLRLIPTRSAGIGGGERLPGGSKANPRSSMAAP